MNEKINKYCRRNKNNERGYVPAFNKHTAHGIDQNNAFKKSVKYIFTLYLFYFTIAVLIRGGGGNCASKYPIPIEAIPLKKPAFIKLIFSHVSHLLYEIIKETEYNTQIPIIKKIYSFLNVFAKQNSAKDNQNQTLIYHATEINKS